MAITGRIGDFMKKVIILFLSLFLLTGCKDDTVTPGPDPVECTDTQVLVNGVCEDIVIPVDRDYEEELMGYLNSFNSDLDDQQVGSVKLDIIVKPTLKPLDGLLDFRVIVISKYDLVNEYYFTSTDTTQTEEFDYVEYLDKTETGYELYYKSTTESNQETITLERTFIEEFNEYAKIDFSFEMTDDVVTVSSSQDYVYKATVTTEFLEAHVDEYLVNYLGDFTNNYVNITFEFRQLDSEYTVTFDLINDDVNGTYEELSVVYTIKILDTIPKYEIPEE